MFGTSSLEMVGMVSRDHQDGLPSWFWEAPKQWVLPQPTKKNHNKHELTREKLGKGREPGYVTKKEVHSLSLLCVVSKGTEDVQMVYDGFKLGLNDAIWVPRFPLPTMNRML
jgi:hypothetical protein